jgi:hypothetical protein
MGLVAVFTLATWGVGCVAPAMPSDESSAAEAEEQALDVGSPLDAVEALPNGAPADLTAGAQGRPTGHDEGAAAFDNGSWPNAVPVGAPIADEACQPIAEDVPEAAPMARDEGVPVVALLKAPDMATAVGGESAYTQATCTGACVKCDWRDWTLCGKSKMNTQWHGEAKWQNNACYCFGTAYYWNYCC